ncbi:MAG TPA: serine hydrolase domain-containing protein [Rectinemataceae bacterium]|nr:serine hydrolase domain-containing protein [Rectinemataceae bacterium]
MTNSIEKGDGMAGAARVAAAAGTGSGVAASAKTAAKAAEAALAGYVAGTLEILAPSSSAILLSRAGKKLVERYERGPRPQSAAPVDADSLWPFWSISKSFAAALVARLAFGGVLGLDMALSRALPEFAERGPGPFDRRKVTLSHLMSHTSGCALSGRIEDGVTLGPPPVLSEVLIATEPGSVFEYSSLGMHVLERFLEALTGSDYGELLRGEVLEPFGLGSVRFLYEEDIAAEAAGPEAAPGAIAGTGRAGRAAPATRATREATRAASRALPCLDGKVVASQPRQRCGLGLYGTARDLLAFGEAWLSMRDTSGKPWCDAAIRDELWSRHSTRSSDASDYGLLWWLFDDLGGRVASGASYSLCALLPRENIVAVVARNHFGPGLQPFDYRSDKRRILELARAFR